ncbi:MAG: hypothetical protein AB8G11_11480 [Saprospiraceae bacterium]
MKLLIPILTDALVVDDIINNNEKEFWARNTDNYEWTMLYQKANPNPLHRTGTAPTGVHLQWILPDFLCHGEQLEQEEVEFPKVPNRWLVNRIWQSDEGEIKTKSWVVLSDFINDDSLQNSNYLYEKDGELVSATIGKVVNLEDFQEHKADELFLTAIGAGNAAFVNYTPNNHNVFSFVDELHDFENEPKVLTYLVTGWYSNSEEIPNLEDLDFEKSENFNGKEFLCHGAIYDVNWYGKAGDTYLSKTGKPKTENDIIIANSSFDAIVRLVQKQMMTAQKLTFEETEQTAQLLAAFEHHILDQIDKSGGLPTLAKAKHKSWFNGEEGGTIWAIQANEPQDNFDKKLKKSKAYHKLNTLNELQLTIDNQLFAKATKQTELYETWIKSNQKHNNNYFRRKYNTLLNDFQLLDKEIIQNKKTSKKLSTELNKIIKKSFDNKATLKQTMRPKFWEANEPVVLIHAAKVSDKYGFDKVLKIRNSNEIINSLKEYYTQQVIDFESRILGTTLSNVEQIPNEIQDLLKETVLLNPNFKSFLYQQFVSQNDSEKTTIESIEKQQTLIWNDEIHRQLSSERLMELAGFSGKKPSLRAFSKALPTWSPMFLDWEVDYFPNGHLKINNWKFEGFDFQFDVNKDELDGDNKITLSGRSILSSQTSKVLEQNLKDFQKTLTNESEKAIIENVIHIIGKFDIVTQQLSGFNEMLLGLDINDIVPITAKNQALKNAVGNKTLGLPMNTNATFPLRGGALIPKTIRITDDFGLAIYPYDERNGKIPPIMKGEGFAHEEMKALNIMVLPPRIVQPSRLTIDLIGNKTGKSLSIAADDNPIIGWIMADYLDKSLEVFSPEGKNIGELITFKRGKRGEVRWLPNDGKAIPNQSLNNFVNGILTYKNSASALSALMRSIDDGLMLNSLKSTNTDSFAMLFGQPLALVRASIRLDVKGIADSRLKNLKFPIQISEQSLAENGVLGYYKSNDFNCFYSNNDKDLSDYIKPKKAEKININAPLEVVLLMNTDGLVHVVSGILPVFELKIPTKYTSSAIENMSVSFRVGPIINDPNNLQLVKPTNATKNISWQQHGKPEQTDFQNATQDGHFPKGKNVLSEGWLKVKE